MRIAVDARALRWAGIGRYTRNIIAGLLKQGGEHQYVLLVRKKDVARFQADFPVASSQYEIFPVDDAYYSWREQIILWRQLMRVKADLFHFTHFNIPVFFRRPYVITIHDVTRFIFPGQRQQALWQQLAYEYIFAAAVKNAQAAITVSETTRQDLAALPLQLPQRVATIPEGVDARFTTVPTAAEQERARLLVGGNDPYLLFVGVWMSHKNIERLLEAFAAVAPKFPSLKLVITGRPKPGFNRVSNLVRDLNLVNRVLFLGFVKDELLPALYANAAAFLFPSLYEGFGLPALEAAACGTPVIAANVSSLPEVMGDAAEYVNPESVPDIARGIERVLTDSSLRAKLVALGHARAQEFTWEKAVHQTLDIYSYLE